MSKLLCRYFTKLLINKIITELLDDTLIKFIFFGFKCYANLFIIIWHYILINKELVCVFVNGSCYSLFTI